MCVENKSSFLKCIFLNLYLPGTKRYKIKIKIKIKHVPGTSFK